MFYNMRHHTLYVLLEVRSNHTPATKVGVNMLQFDMEKMGYDPQQVDEYLEGLQARYDALYHENQRKRAVVNALVLYCKAQAKQGEDVLNGVLQYVPPDVPLLERPPKTIPYVQYAATFAKANGLPEPGRAAPKKRGSAMGSILYYGVLLLMLFCVFLYSQSNSHRDFFGFSYYNILTSSMQSTIPQGSFILVRNVPGSELEIGDDITFFMDANTLVTHRIIDIYPDYENSGQYGFQTKGTDNTSPDANITYEGNVVGKVMFHIPMLGFMLEWASNNVVMVVIGFVLIMLLVFFVQMAFFGDELANEEPLDAVDQALLKSRKGVAPKADAMPVQAEA